MAMLEFHTRRAIRFQIEKASERQGIELDQHMIENLVNQRIVEMANDAALGVGGAVDWNKRVKDAHKILEEARAQKRQLNLKFMLGDTEI